MDERAVDRGYVLGHVPFASDAAGQCSAGVVEFRDAGWGVDNESRRDAVGTAVVGVVGDTDALIVGGAVERECGKIRARLHERYDCVHFRVGEGGDVGFCGAAGDRVNLHEF